MVKTDIFHLEAMAKVRVDDTLALVHPRLPSLDAKHGPVERKGGRCHLPFSLFLILTFAMIDCQAILSKIAIISVLDL